MARLAFSVTWDYRCPFAFRFHDHVVTALEAGADWDVSFVPFSLGQVHVEEGEPDIWDHPDDDSGLFALQVGVAIRDHQPEHFLVAHRALFEVRHRDRQQLRDRDAVRAAIEHVGVDADAAFAEVESGAPLETIRKEHERAVADVNVWGVPTLIAGDDAAFIRLMHGSDGDADASQKQIERLLGLLVCCPELNEFKHTSVPR